MEFNKNDKQQQFNQIKGTITQLNEYEKYCSVTVKAGHENPRDVNLTCKKQLFELIKNLHKVGDRVSITYYLVSRFKTHWHTTANILSIEKMEEAKR